MGEREREEHKKKEGKKEEFILFFFFSSFVFFFLSFSACVFEGEVSYLAALFSCFFREGIASSSR